MRALPVVRQRVRSGSTRKMTCRRKFPPKKDELGAIRIDQRIEVAVRGSIALRHGAIPCLLIGLGLKIFPGQIHDCTARGQGEPRSIAKDSPQFLQSLRNGSFLNRRVIGAVWYVSFHNKEDDSDNPLFFPISATASRHAGTDLVAINQGYRYLGNIDNQ